MVHTRMFSIVETKENTLLIIVGDASRKLMAWSVVVMGVGGKFWSRTDHGREFVMMILRDHNISLMVVP
jgi:tricorn protease-like protein